jgi:arylesterase/paraoxonase
MLFGVKSTSVGYCHVKTGCKVAADELYSSNGIVRVSLWVFLNYTGNLTGAVLQSSDGDVWVGSSGGGYITVHEQQADKTLVPTDVIHIGENVCLSLILLH